RVESSNDAFSHLEIVPTPKKVASRFFRLFFLELRADPHRRTAEAATRVVDTSPSQVEEPDVRPTARLRPYFRRSRSSNNVVSLSSETNRNLVHRSSAPAFVVERKPRRHPPPTHYVAPRQQCDRPSLSRETRGAPVLSSLAR